MEVISVGRIYYLKADLTMKAGFLSKYVLLRTATNEAMRVNSSMPEVYVL